MADPALETHPGKPVPREDTNVAVERQHHGHSQTEAALFNVNIDFFFFQKGQQFQVSLSLSHVYSLMRALSLLLIHLFSLKA